MPVKAKFDGDLTRPCMTPGDVRSAIKHFQEKEISMRMLSHSVQTTIGESTVPADGPGRAREFSVQDVVLILIGEQLRDMGLSPARIRTCTDAIRGQWDLLVSAAGDVFLCGEYMQPYGGHFDSIPLPDKPTFVVNFMPRRLMIQQIEVASVFRRPFIVLNVSREVQDLAAKLSNALSSRK